MFIAVSGNRVLILFSSFDKLRMTYELRMTLNMSLIVRQSEFIED
jgi:hypothetical protein